MTTAVACPQCRNDNRTDARFCARCGLPFLQPAAAMASVVEGGRRRFLLRRTISESGRDYLIKDAQRQDAYLVDRHAYRQRRVLYFRDAYRRELARITRETGVWGDGWMITRDSHLVAVVKKSPFSFLKCAFTVDVPGPEDLTAEGNLKDYEYTFRRGHQKVAEVSKRWFAIAKTYGVTVEPHEDQVLALVAAVVIDLACHSD